MGLGGLDQQGRNWKFLRFSLLIFLCIDLLKCHGEAATIQADDDIPVMIPVPDRLRMTTSKRPVETAKRRLRRSLNTEFALGIHYGHVPGIAASRYEVLRPPYNDGKECGTGQEPFSHDEAKLVEEHYFKAIKSLREDGNGRFQHTFPIFVEMTNLMRLSVDNCKSKKCNFDSARVSYVCGPPVQHAFKDETNCRDGSKVPKGRVIKDYRYAFKNQAEFNKAVKDAYGKNCKSKKCYYHFEKDVQICGATTLVTSWYLCFLGFVSVISQYYGLV